MGSGISGLATAYLLGRQHEVHVFEAERRAGGHANTVRAGQDGTPVDTGFIVYNELNYPHLTGLFRHLEVPVADSEMTLSVRFHKPNLEWGGTNLATLFAQKRNLVRAPFWGMVRDILKFNRLAATNLQLARQNHWSLGELLKVGRFGRPFVDWYLLPMGAAIWSTPAESMLDFPAETFLQFCMNHRLLQVDGRPQWKTVRGGSIEYVRRLLVRLPHVHLDCPVSRVVRHQNGVDLYCHDVKNKFDAVVFASHPPETLKMLDASAEERKILGAFSYQKNRAHLHSDISFLPRRKSIWSSWNFHQAQSGASQTPVGLSYWMNRLQPLGTDRNWIVSLNADQTPAELEAEFVYEHPLFNRGAIEAQAQLSRIQGRGGVYFAGAWTRYGFHEDGILSAVKIAESFQIQTPWTTATDPYPKPHLNEVTSL